MKSKLDDTGVLNGCMHEFKLYDLQTSENETMHC